MQEAVIVSTARTPIGKAYRGAFNDTEAPVLGGHVIRAALDKAGRRRRRRRRRHPRHRRPAGQPGLQPGAPVHLHRRPAGVGRRHDDRPHVRLRPGQHRHRRQGHHERRIHHRRRRRPRIDLAGAEPAQEQPPGAVAGGAGGGADGLHPDDRNRRDRVAALRHFARRAGRVFAPEPAAHRGRPAGRPVCRRDRAAGQRAPAVRQGRPAGRQRNA